VGNTSLRLVATSSFYDDSDGRGRLSVVDDRDALASTTVAKQRRETALDTQVCAHASIIISRQVGDEAKLTFVLPLGSTFCPALGTYPDTWMRHARGFSFFQVFLGRTEQGAPTTRAVSRAEIANNECLPTLHN
jgi:hypothetical protein